MKKLDQIMLHVDEFGELRNQFRELWVNEPLKLNAFISGGEFALNDFKVILYKDASIDFNIDYHYSTNTKILTIDDEQHGYQGKIKNCHVITDNYSNHKGELQQDIEIGYESKKHKEILKEGTALAKSIKNPQNWISDLGILFWAFNMVVIALPHKIKEREEKVNKTIETKKNGRKVYKSVVYLQHTYYLPPKFRLTKTDLHHIIKCPAWGVRGHQRHLRTGQVVFVKPYIKGKMRNDGDKYVAKNYKL